MDQESNNPNDYRQGFKKSLQACLWVWQELLGEEGRKATKRIIIFICIGNVISMSVPWMLGKMISGLEAHHSSQVIQFFLGIALALLLRRGIQYFESHAREIMFGANQGTIDVRTSELFFAKSIGQHLRERETLSSAGINRGRTRSHETLNMLPIEGGEIIFLLSTSYLALWFISPFAGCITTALLAIYICWALYLNQCVAEVCVPLDEKFRELDRYRVERWDEVRYVKALGKEKEEVTHIRNQWNELINRDRRFWLWFADQSTLRNVVSACALISVMIWSVWQAWVGDRHFGMLFPLFTWMSNIIDNIWRLGAFEHRINWNLPSIQSLREALTMKPDVADRPDAQELQVQNGVHIKFHDVSHAYHPSQKKTRNGQTSRTVLRGINLEIPPGDVIAIIGPSGAGKSTLMSLLQRGADPEHGAILINHRDLRDIKLASWLQHIGYIPQHPTVLSGTVRYNLTYGLPTEERSKVPDDELWALIQSLQLHHRLTHGLDTLVGEGGIELSGGEKQRLVIGAAIVKRPPFLIVDEATSSLDSTTERAVQRCFTEVLGRGAGAMIIAHRFDTVRHLCKRFVVLRPIDELRNGDSQIEAQATSLEALYQISPTFRRLADDQHLTL